MRRNALLFGTQMTDPLLQQDHLGGLGETGANDAIEVRTGGEVRGQEGLLEVTDLHLAVENLSDLLAAHDGILSARQELLEIARDANPGDRLALREFVCGAWGQALSTEREQR